jgi:hypothetical protein
VSEIISHKNYERRFEKVHQQFVRTINECTRCVDYLSKQQTESPPASVDARSSTLISTVVTKYILVQIYTLFDDEGKKKSKKISFETLVNYHKGYFHNDDVQIFLDELKKIRVRHCVLLKRIRNNRSKGIAHYENKPVLGHNLCFKVLKARC